MHMKLFLHLEIWRWSSFTNGEANMLYLVGTVAALTAYPGRMRNNPTQPTPCKPIFSASKGRPFWQAGEFFGMQQIFDILAVFCSWARVADLDSSALLRCAEDMGRLLQAEQLCAHE
jgi:hypothetical protein